MGEKCAASHKIWFPHLSPTVSTPPHQTPLVGLAGPLELYALLMNLRGKNVLRDFQQLGIEDY